MGGGDVRKASTMSSPPSVAKRSWSWSAVSWSVMGIARFISIPPVSRPASICMIVMPLCVSPASIARWMGAAPRQRGNNEAWMLMQPRGGNARMACGKIKP